MVAERIVLAIAVLNLLVLGLDILVNALSGLASLF
jgi:hypothetical protein